MKRLHVRVDDDDHARFVAAARRRGVELPDWVRESLRAASRHEARLAAIGSAARHAFPAPDIDRMLAEIDRGRDAGHSA